jgi:hypothetical protein
MADGRRASPPRAMRGSSGAGSEAREVVHEIQNNLAAIQLWLAMLATKPCADCRAHREEVATAIERNVTAAIASSTKLTPARRMRPS